MKIAHKLLLTFAGIVFLVAITFLAFVYRSFSVTMETQIRSEMVAVSSYAMEKIDRLLYRRYEKITALADDPVISSRTSSPSQITKKMVEFEKHFSHRHPNASLSFYDLKRKRIADTEGKDLGIRDPLTDFWTGIRAGRAFVLSVSRPDSLHESFCFAHVVKDRHGIPFGVVVARTPVEELHFLSSRPLGLFRAGLIPNIDLVDKDGVILYSDHDPRGALRDTVSNWDLIKKALSSGKRKGSMIISAAAKSHGDDILIYAAGEGHAILGANKWTLVINLPKEAVLSPVLEMRNILLIIISVLGLVALSVAYVLSRTITKPIIQLSNAAAEIGRGNRDVRVRIDSGDEVGQLGRSFNLMAENLAETEKEREELVADLRNALATIKTLEGILPICSCCKKIRDDEGDWNHIESYISKHTDATFTHSLCMDCARKLYPEQFA